MNTNAHTGVCPYCRSVTMGNSPNALPALALLRSTVMDIERALDLLGSRTQQVDILEKCEMRG